MDGLTIYILSDSTGVTCETVLKAAMSQFPEQGVSTKRFSGLQNLDELEEALEKILANREYAVIFYSIVDPVLLQHVHEFIEYSKISAVDILTPAVTALSRAFSSDPLGISRGRRILDSDYFRRIDAVEFAVKYDDGKDPRGILLADLVLIGISRTSKTPLSMYLANFGCLVANLPLLPESEVPKELYQISPRKIIGLINTPQNLLRIRKQRLRNLGLPQISSYGEPERIQEEIDYANGIMKEIGCAILDVSNRAIEETADIIIKIIEKNKEESGDSDDAKICIQFP